MLVLSCFCISTVCSSTISFLLESGKILKSNLSLKSGLSRKARKPAEMSQICKLEKVEYESSAFIREFCNTEDGKVFELNIRKEYDNDFFRCSVHNMIIIGHKKDELVPYYQCKVQNGFKWLVDNHSKRSACMIYSKNKNQENTANLKNDDKFCRIFMLGNPTSKFTCKTEKLHAHLFHTEIKIQISRHKTGWKTVKTTVYTGDCISGLTSS